MHKMKLIKDLQGVGKIGDIIEVNDDKSTGGFTLASNSSKKIPLGYVDVATASDIANAALKQGSDSNLKKAEDFITSASNIIASLPQKQRSDYEIFLKKYAGSKPLAGANSVKMQEYQKKVAEATKIWMDSQNIPTPTTETKSNKWIWIGVISSVVVIGGLIVYFKFIRK